MEGLLSRCSVPPVERLLAAALSEGIDEDLSLEQGHRVFGESPGRFEALVIHLEDSRRRVAAAGGLPFDVAAHQIGSGRALGIAVVVLREHAPGRYRVGDDTAERVTQWVVDLRALQTAAPHIPRDVADAGVACRVAVVVVSIDDLHDGSR